MIKGLEKLLIEKPEAYYWAGFIMADGTFSHSRPYFKIDISSKDENHLMKMSKFLRLPIQYGEWKYKNKLLPYVRLNSYHKDSILKIIKKFNFKERKTYNPPTRLRIKNDDLFLAFFIGYLDGDGHISNFGALKISCHESWRSTLQKWINRTWKISDCKIINRKMVKLKVTINKRGLANFETSNNQYLWFLKSKINDLGLPMLHRKWNRLKIRKIKYEDIYNRNIKIIKCLKDKEKGINISREFNVSPQYISRIKAQALKNNFDKSKCIGVK